MLSVFQFNIQIIVHTVYLKGCPLPENAGMHKDLCCLYLSSGHLTEFMWFMPRAPEAWKGTGVYQLSTPYLMDFTVILTHGNPSRTAISFLCAGLAEREKFTWGLCALRSLQKNKKMNILNSSQINSPYMEKSYE